MNPPPPPTARDHPTPLEDPPPPAPPPRRPAGVLIATVWCFAAAGIRFWVAALSQLPSSNRWTLGALLLKGLIAAAVIHLWPRCLLYLGSAVILYLFVTGFPYSAGYGVAALLLIYQPRHLVTKVATLVALSFIALGLCFWSLLILSFSEEPSSNFGDSLFNYLPLAALLATLGIISTYLFSPAIRAYYSPQRP